MDDPARPSRPPWLAIGCVVAFAALSGCAAAGILDRPDRAVLRLCDNHRHAALISASSRLTDVLSPLTDSIALGIGAALTAWRRRRLRPLAVAALMGWVMAAIVYGTKAAVARPHPTLSPVLTSGLSFPSGHTAAFAVCLGALVLIWTTRHRSRRTPLLLVVAAGTVAVAFALVYAGYHWLSDTVASMLLAVALLDLQRRYLSPASARDRTYRRPRAPATTRR